MYEYGKVLQFNYFVVLNQSQIFIYIDIPCMVHIFFQIASTDNFIKQLVINILYTLGNFIST